MKRISGRTMLVGAVVLASVLSLAAGARYVTWEEYEQLLKSTKRLEDKLANVANDIEELRTLLDTYGAPQKERPKTVPTADPQLMPPQVAKLIKQIRDGDRFVRRRKVQELEKLGVAAVDAARFLAHLTRADEDRFTRKYAAGALGAVCARSRGALRTHVKARLYYMSLYDPWDEAREGAWKTLQKYYGY